MNAIKAILAAIASFAQVFGKLGDAANKGADSLNNLADLGVIKSKNYVKQVKLRDNEAFEAEMHKINALRAKRNLAPAEVKSTQAEQEPDAFGGAFAQPPKAE